MSEKKKKIVVDEEAKRNKTELANRIAEQSKRVANTYEALENNLFRLGRWFSSIIDRVLFSRKHAKLVSLLLAALLYIMVNYNTVSSLIAKPLEYSRTIEDVPISARYNSDTFELSGLSDTVDVIVYGDATSVTNAMSSEGLVVADLEGLTEGNHEIQLKSEGFGSGVNVAIEPSNAMVTLKKKTTAQFDLSYDYIHLDQMDSIYSVGTPQFETAKVNVRASKDTLDTIAFVKALIDVSGKSSDFDQEAKLIAYNADGVPVDADIVPNSITVHVPVTSPNKTVPIEIEITGEVPDNKAIKDISMDQQAVTIFGPENVLREIERVMVTLNASTITKDSTILRPIVLPNGINSSSINQITLSVSITDLATKTITDVPINYINNTNNFKASQPDNITTTTVIVSGSKENIDLVEAKDINVYIDMKDVQPGLQEFQLFVDQPANGLVKYALKDSKYELNVLGESETIEGENVGGDSDNG